MKRFLYTLVFLAALSSAAAAQTPATTTPPAPAPQPAEDCGCEAPGLPEAFAVVNGVRLTAQDLSPETRARVAELQRQVVEARRRELDLQINSRLLEAEAQKRGKTATQLLEEEVVAKTQEPTEADARAFYEQHKARIGGEFEALKGDIVAHLRAERQRELAGRFSERLRAAADLKVIAASVTPPASAADRARLLATVNGQRITSGDIEESLRPLVHAVQSQAFELRRRDIELRINDLLLSEEAQRRKVTVRALLEAEVVAKTPAVTEAQARSFYDQNRERINGEFAQVQGQIVQYLKDEEARKLEVALAAGLRRAASVQTFLAAPEPPAYRIATDDQPAKGNPNARVTVVEFTDFQCPSCAQLQPVLERLLGEYGDRVRLVVRDFPLSQHTEAFKAAEAAEAAREQGKYWEFASRLFGSQKALGVDRLKQFAGELGLDRARFDAALDSGRHADKVRRDLLDGQKIGVQGTPSLYVNGRLVSERTYEGLKKILDEALASVSQN